MRLVRAQAAAEAEAAAAAMQPKLSRVEAPVPKQKTKLTANQLRFVQSLAMRDAGYNEASLRSLWVKIFEEDRNFLQSLENLLF